MLENAVICSWISKGEGLSCLSTRHRSRRMPLQVCETVKALELLSSYVLLHSCGTSLRITYGTFTSKLWACHESVSVCGAADSTVEPVAIDNKPHGGLLSMLWL